MLLILNTTLMVAGLFLLISVILMLGLIMTGYKKIPQGNALIRTGVGGTKIAINDSLFAFPLLHSVEVMDITVKAVKINLLGKNALRFKDNVPVDIKVTFFIGVIQNVIEIRNVAQNIGAAECSKVETLLNLFETELSEALTIAAKDHNFEELSDSQDEFYISVLKYIFKLDLRGYYTYDIIINSLEKTPNTVFDEANTTLQEPLETDSASIQDHKS